MNKQELIKEYESIVKDDSLELCIQHGGQKFYEKDLQICFGSLEQLDEPQKVTITQFVADLISTNMQKFAIGTQKMFF